MNERTTAKPIFPQNYLITPSASPPGSRIRTTVPPPAKKRRFASTTSSSSFSASTPSSSRTDPVQHDLHDARRASARRVLDIWSSLAARYNRPIDEDDIIDLRTGDIVKDRGVVEGLPQDFEIGYFADAEGALNMNDASSGAQTEAEDDVDELDAFAPENQEIKLEPKPVPPVQVMNPADADDLREFMEAERTRKELDGEDEEEFSEDDNPSESDLEVSSIHSLSRDTSPLQAVDDDSDDEFGAWAVDEGSTIYQVLSNQESDEEPCLPSSPPVPVSIPPSHVAPVSPLPVSPLPVSLKARPPEARPQLLTPPRSSSAALDRSLDDIDTRFPPPQVRARTKSVKPRVSSPDSDIPSPPKIAKLKKVAKPKQKVVPQVVLTRLPAAALEVYSEGSIKTTKMRLTSQKVVKPKIRTQDEFEEGSSTQNRSPKPKSKPKQRKQSTKHVSPPIREQKRKRATSTTSQEDLPDSYRDASDSDSDQKLRSKSRSGFRSRPSDSDSKRNGASSTTSHNDFPDSYCDAPNSEFDKKSRQKSRSEFHTHSEDSDSNAYPYSSHYTAQQRHSSQYPSFQPIQDPKAQYIIAQAMHQLAYMMSSPPPPPPPNGWPASGSGYPAFPSPYQFPWPPFTPSHHHRPDGDGSSSSNHHTPSHHPYPYSYMFDPSGSRSTLPPSSPPPESSSPVKEQSGGRSKSRGRRVLFNLESPGSEPNSSGASRNFTRESSPIDPNRSRKGKSKARVVESSEDEVEIISSPSRSPQKLSGRKAVSRGRTPGPGR